jgi:hypothetical protein
MNHIPAPAAMRASIRKAVEIHRPAGDFSMPSSTLRPAREA